MTLRTILGSHKSQNSLFCLVSWIEENTLSVISMDKIVSPSKEDITVGCMCKVKKFEKYLAQVKAIGLKEEVNAVLNELERDDELEPPAKKAKKDKNKENQPKLKQKQTTTAKKGKQQMKKREKTKAPGAIIVVGAEDDDNDKQQKQSDESTLPLTFKPTAPTRDDRKQKSNNNTPPLPPNMPSPIHVPSPPTHPPPSHSVADNELSFFSMSSLSSSSDDKEPLNSSYENDVSDSDPLLLEMTVQEYGVRLEKLEDKMTEVNERLEVIKRIESYLVQTFRIPDYVINPTCRNVAPPPPLPPKPSTQPFQLYTPNPSHPSRPGNQPLSTSNDAPPVPPKQTPTPSLPQLNSSHPFPSEYGSQPSMSMGYQSPSHARPMLGTMDPQFVLPGQTKQKTKSFGRLQSSVIDKCVLIPVDAVLVKYPALVRKEGKAGELA